MPSCKRYLAVSIVNENNGLPPPLTRNHHRLSCCHVAEYLVGSRPGLCFDAQAAMFFAASRLLRPSHAICFCVVGKELSAVRAYADHVIGIIEAVITAYLVMKPFPAIHISRLYLLIVINLL